MIEYKYWTTDEEKKILNKALKENEIKYRNKLREQYNPDDIFKNNKHKKEKENIVKNEIYITEYKESLFKKIINKIRNIFK